LQDCAGDLTGALSHSNLSRCSTGALGSGAFCSVTVQRLLSTSFVTLDETKTDFLGNPQQIKTPYVEKWFGENIGHALIDWSVPVAIRGV